MVHSLYLFLNICPLEGKDFPVSNARDLFNLMLEAYTAFCIDTCEIKAENKMY